MIKSELEIQALKKQLIKENYDIEDFKDIIRVLRSKTGCPWDSVQTHESLKNCLIEECYEVIEAINKKDCENLKEELGDVLLQVVMHSIMEEEQNHFNFEDVVNRVSRKMVYRHPNVFSIESEDVNCQNTSKKSWEELKQAEKQKYLKSDSDNKIDVDGLSSVPVSFPALLRAQKVLKKADKKDEKIKSLEECITDIKGRMEELENMDSKMQYTNIDKILGQTLLDLTNIAYRTQQNAENSLTNAVEQFINKREGNA